MTLDSEKFLNTDDQWTVVTEGVPYKILSFNETPDEVQAIPDLIYAEDQFQTIASIRTAQVSHIKKFVRIMLAQKGFVTVEEQQKFADAEDGTFVEVKNIDKIKPAEFVSYGPDMDKTNDSSKTDLREVLGQSEIARGGVLEQRRTLGEVEMIEKGGHSRIEERVDLVEDYCEEIAKGFIVVMKQKFDRERMVRITGFPDLVWPPPGFDEANKSKFHMDTQGFAYTKDDLLGDVDIGQLVHGKAVGTVAKSIAGWELYRLGSKRSEAPPLRQNAKRPARGQARLTHQGGGRCWDRTSDPYRVKVVLYR